MRPDKKAIAPTLNESPSEKEGKSLELNALAGFL